MARLGDCALSQLNHQLNHDVIVSLCVLEYIRQVFVQRRLLFVDRFLFAWGGEMHTPDGHRHSLYPSRL